MTDRVVVISEDLAAPWDEGIKKFAYSVGRSLKSRYDVRIMNVDRTGVGGTNGIVRIPGTRTFMNPVLRRELRSYGPDAILYVPSPSSTPASFVRTYALRRHAPRAKIGMVALIPRRHSNALKPFLAAAAPDVVFVPSYQSLLHIHELRLHGVLAPVGVDLSVFRPPQPGEREALRDKYAVERDAFVYLHVGHLSANRNVRQLVELTKSGATEVIVIGSTSTRADEEVRSALERGGVRVIREYVSVEHFYRLADCYVFPVVNHEGCVEIPLSVMEALASGLCVVTRPFGGLRDFLKPGPDVVYRDSLADLTAAAIEQRGRSRPVTRSMEMFAWENVARLLVDELEGSVR